MSQLEYRGPQTVLGFKDKSALLITVGILLLIGAALLGCMTSMIPLSIAMQRGMNVGNNTPIQAEPMSNSQAVAAVLMYLALTIAFAWIGMGAILKRRWARPMTLILCAHWTLVGIGTLVVLIAMTPMLMDLFAAQGMGQNAGLVAVIVGAIFTLIFLVGLPLILLFLVRPDDVRLTVEHYDGRPRWTDRVTLPLLGGVVTLAVLGILLILSAPVGVVGFFGLLVTGPIAMGIMAIEGAVYVLAAWRMYRLDRRGWLLALLATALMMVSTTLTALIVPPAEFIRHTTNDPAQIEQIERHQGLSTLVSTGGILLLGIALLVYVWRLKKHLDQPPAVVIATPVAPVDV